MEFNFSGKSQAVISLHLVSYTLKSCIYEAIIKRQSKSEGFAVGGFVERLHYLSEFFDPQQKLAYPLGR
jgi:hypothetical protein